MLTIEPVIAPAVTSSARACRVRLTPGPIAAAQARRQVRLALAVWNVPVDADIAVLLTSDLVTHALQRAPAGAVTLTASCASDLLRVDVHDCAPAAREPAGVLSAATGRGEPGLALVARLSAEWGSARTPAGQSAYFKLAFEPDRALRPLAHGSL